MKFRTRDYVYVLWDIFVASPVRRLFIQLRYFVELGGKGGYEIYGAPKFWGRYGTPEKIAELAAQLKGEDDDVSFYLPAVQHDLKYSHKINIWGSENGKEVLIEFIYSSDQCGSYEKSVELASLLQEIELLVEAQKNITNYGYKYVEY